MDITTVRKDVRRTWDAEILPSLTDYIAIPALSPMFDAGWATSGQLDRAVEHLRGWLAGRGIPGATVEVLRLPGLTPLLLMDVPATGGAGGAGTVLLYGHLDKQPPCGEWSEGLGPWTPVRRENRLYGRGAVDDGYAGYAATAAIEAVHAAGGRHARCVVILEASEESGSPHLPAYLEHLRPRLGEVSLVVCLDSGGNDYGRLWLSTSLRGLAQLELTVRVLPDGLHSGIASGIVPSSFRIMRVLLDRLENAATGEILLPELHVDIPAGRIAETRASVATLPGLVLGAFELAGDTRPVTGDEVELLLNSSWRPTLSVIGASGFPEPVNAGNVLRPHSTLKLSFRLPPTADAQVAIEAVRRALTTDVPYGAVVEIDHSEATDGWHAPPLAPWLSSTLDGLSESVFGNPWRTVGVGGSIPFMAMLARGYPQAQFVVTGAGGKDSNAHVPDEWLNLDQAVAVTESVAWILNAHAGES